MTTKNVAPRANTKIIEVQVELDLDAPTSTSKAGASIWRGEATTSDGYRVFFQVYAPSPQKAKAQGLKVSLK